MGKTYIPDFETLGHAAEPLWTGLGKPERPSALRSRGNNGSPGLSLEEATALRTGLAVGRQREVAYSAPKGKPQLSCDVSVVEVLILSCHQESISEPETGTRKKASSANICVHLEQKCESFYAHDAPVHLHSREKEGQGIREIEATKRDQLS